MELVWVLDCPDPDALAPFWAAALGYETGPAGGVYRGLRDPRGHWPTMLLQRVTDPKVGKNRMHLDIRVRDMDPELARLRGLGATVVRGPFDDDGWLTAVLADPAGNEFCAIVPPERQRPSE
ncbi:MAG TPA: VOC family protein [Streptosporangiaceae bacterium]|jgi:predicted enzyme related to lactoylglutathione lyase